MTLQNVSFNLPPRVGTMAPLFPPGHVTISNIELGVVVMKKLMLMLKLMLCWTLHVFGGMDFFWYTMGPLSPIARCAGATVCPCDSSCCVTYDIHAAAANQLRPSVMKLATRL